MLAQGRVRTRVSSVGGIRAARDMYDTVLALGEHIEPLRLVVADVARLL